MEHLTWKEERDVGISFPFGCWTSSLSLGIACNSIYGYPNSSLTCYNTLPVTLKMAGPVKGSHGKGENVCHLTSCWYGQFCCSSYLYSRTSVQIPYTQVGSDKILQQREEIVSTNNFGYECQHMLLTNHLTIYDLYTFLRLWVRRKRNIYDDMYSAIVSPTILSAAPKIMLSVEVLWLWYNLSCHSNEILFNEMTHNVDLSNHDWWLRSIRETSKDPRLGQEGPQPWDPHFRDLFYQNTDKNTSLKEYVGLLSLRISPQYWAHNLSYSFLGLTLFRSRKWLLYNSYVLKPKSDSFQIL